MSEPDSIAPISGDLPRSQNSASWRRGADAELGDSVVKVLLEAVSPPGSHHWMPPAVEDLQRMLPQYEVQHFVARGGMGAVYRGVQRSLDRVVAIKVMPATAEDGKLGYAGRFQQEAKAMAKFKHPGIVTVYEAGQTEEGLLYFVMEFVEGTDVARLLTAERIIPAARAVSIAIKVCEALACAHHHGVVHRDIKPSNIMLDGDGTVKVADFGLAKIIAQHGDGFTRTNLAVGTPDFAAPEMCISGMPVDGRADLYSLGVTLYQMLTGNIPRGRFELPSGVIAQSDPRLDAVVEKAMRPDRENRYADADAMRGALEQILHGASGAVVSARSTESTVVLKRRPQAAARPWRKFLAVFAMVATALVLVTTVFLVIKTKPPSRGGDSASASGGPDAEPARTWSPAFPDLEKLPGVHEARNGWVHFESDASRLYYLSGNGDPQSLGNCGVSARFRAISDAIPRWSKLVIRKDGMKPLPTLRYLPPAAVGEAAELRIELDIEGGRSFVTVASGKVDPPLQDGEEYTMEFYAIGRQLIGRLNKQTLTAKIEHDDLPPRGALGIWGTDRNWLRDVKVINLDGLPEAEAMKLAGVEAGGLSSSGGHRSSESDPAAATTAQPFVNSLGMKFLPVAGTEVLFSEWETRVVDYAAFAVANSMDPAWKSQRKENTQVGTEAMHPAAGVSWDEANAFCDWLTKKETAEGRLPRGKLYRLPADEEWSRAVGLASELGSTPKERTVSNGTDFPWGKTFPPPNGQAGNYGDTTFHDKFPDSPWIEGYTDGHAATAPVGSFPPNQHGLYDLGGNVWEWCADLYEPGSDERVLRGGSWMSYSRGSLASAFRLHSPPGNHGVTGFRCVLATEKTP